MGPKVHLLSVFGTTPTGGNLAPIVVDARGMSDAAMKKTAYAYGHESGFVLPASVGSECDFTFRFWVPNHEMEMCGHATVGALWLLSRLGELKSDRVSISTKSGRVDGRVVVNRNETVVEITQPKAKVENLPANGKAHFDVLSVLGLTSTDLAPYPIQNACTSRVKTLVPLRNASILNGLRPDFSRMEAVCQSIGSTGLYPYAPLDPDRRLFDARQFPKSSGYPEDAATGIAAAALSFGLLANGVVFNDGQPVLVRQGWTMGRPSEMHIRFRSSTSGEVEGCWIGGPVRFAEPDSGPLPR